TPPILGVHARFSGVNPWSKEKPPKTRQKPEWRAKQNPRFSGKILNKKDPEKAAKSTMPLHNHDSKNRP
ncbi:hypothetical protein, partial [Acetobacter orleanensis]|uniref:hypothetical protein n=1 Tax=Acetobacter orleanensis TaxID=104099 RepID=UPI001C53EFDA